MQWQSKFKFHTKPDVYAFDAAARIHDAPAFDKDDEFNENFHAGMQFMKIKSIGSPVILLR